MTKETLSHVSCGSTVSPEIKKVPHASAPAEISIKSCFSPDTSLVSKFEKIDYLWSRKSREPECNEVKVTETSEQQMDEDREHETRDDKAASNKHTYVKNTIRKFEKSSGRTPRQSVQNIFTQRNKMQLSEQELDKGTAWQMNQKTTDSNKSTCTHAFEKRGNTSSSRTKPMLPTKPPPPEKKPWTVLAEHSGTDHLYRDSEHRRASGDQRATKNTQSCGSPSEPIAMLLYRLGLENNINDKLTTADFLKISNVLPETKRSETELVQLFMQRLMAVDYRARSKEDVKLVHTKKQPSIHLMDIQMALFLCADNFLRQTMVTKLSECQYAVPLLVPNPFSRRIEFPLWTLRKITKNWKRSDHTGNKVTIQNQPMYKAETPMVAFLRFGSVSSSKSQLINALINEKHNTFFHRNCLGNSKSRLLVDGLVEISWYCPSGNSTDHYNDCVAFCNLHGDASVNQKQREILISSASVVVIFLPDRKTYADVKALCGATTSQILILTEEEDDDEDATHTVQETRRIGLKGRNMSEVGFELRHIIKNDLKARSVPFSIEKLPRLPTFPGVSLDEDDNRCRKGKQAAERVVSLLYTVPSKEAILPCQGQLWHNWCLKNKELRQIPNITAEEISKRHYEMRTIRCKQLEHGINEPMRLFIESLVVFSDTTDFFLRWMEILLEERNSGYSLEHFVREMGQLYEASVSGTVLPAGYVPQIYSHFPTLAAKMLISGHQLELMDGDASYVPVTWMSAVLDEVIKILGDPRVFVLSVLGIQSSGKSTMLNALFGFQFKVNAGKCTRGAFMQLVGVSEEMKRMLRADYILVIDTEGLRASYSSTSHDNELATFVVAIGNLTLINIYGENPSEMQEILQIVLHAFLRMKKIQLKACCMFVHQNVCDIAAGDKTIKERTYLKEMLDETTQLAARGESVLVEDFNDVIAFDEHNDVKYFSSYFEGSPPMAPQNPAYSQCIQELKQNIILHAIKANSLTLSQFQKQMKDIWEALLNEDFVFSFRNAREISVYRKLEQEFENWAWSLRSAMLTIEFKMLNRVAGGVLDTVQAEELKNEMAAKWNQIQNDFDSYFEKSNHKQILSHWRDKFKIQLQNLHDDLIEGAKRKVSDAIQLNSIRRTMEQQWKNFERETFERCRSLALQLKGHVDSEETADREFDAMWQNLASKLTEHAPVIRDIDLLNDMTKVLGDMYTFNLVNERRALSEYKAIVNPKVYKRYIKRHESMRRTPPMSSSLSFLKPRNNQAIRNLILQVTEEIKTTVELFQLSVHGYNLHYIHLIAKQVRSTLQNFELSSCNRSRTEEGFDGLSKEFYVDLSFYVCEQFEVRIMELHGRYKEANDPHIYLQEKKAFYFGIFHKFWKGAASAAIIGAQICTRLKEPILQSVYNRIANFVCEQMRGKPPFNGNRADLEKHILKSLAEQTGPKNERFNKYLLYMYAPQAHFKSYIVDRVRDFMATENPRAVYEIKECIDSKLRAVIGAALKATADVKDNEGNTNMWLRLFSESLADELGDTRIQNYDEEENDTDLSVLVDVIKNELPSVGVELQRTFATLSDINMQDFRERPEDILIQHFCVCCWEQCPFCGAVCTNSQKDHPGDHNADFHRTAGMNGVYYNESTEFFIDFCTTAVASNDLFSPKHDSSLVCPFKNYRSAGGKYSKWRISTDFTELVYWKWFLCEFQEELEWHHKKKFQGYGKIHDEWKHYNLQNAIASLGIC